MPSYVLKADQNRDLYVEWSSIVDDATFIGTREELLTYLRLRGDSSEVGIHSPEARLERADETGTSCRWRIAGHPPTGAWDDAYLVVGQGRRLRRADLALYADADTDDDAYALLIPFENSA